MSERSFKTGRLRVRLGILLHAADFDLRRSEWSLLPARKTISPLLSFLYSPDETIKWRAVTAVGIVMAKLADEDTESARVVMRRLIWSLNDESGGIGWGAPEAMGEIMAVHEALADEYVHILVSYIRSDCNRLENDLLERGVLWGLGRVAQVRPQLLQERAFCFVPYLESTDPMHRGLAARALGFLDARAFHDCLRPLLKDGSPLLIFEDGISVCCSVSELAQRAMGLREL